MWKCVSLLVIYLAILIFLLMYYKLFTSYNDHGPTFQRERELLHPYLSSIQHKDLTVVWLWPIHPNGLGLD